jgi:CheY-like chemotaxis protein
MSAPGGVASEILQRAPRTERGGAGGANAYWAAGRGSPWQERNPTGTEQILKVLVADHESAIRRLLAATLGTGAHEVLQARDGAEALETIRRERPDIAFLDVQMPDMDGAEVCRRVRTDDALSGTFVVLLTVLAQVDACERTRVACADAFPTKPFSPIELLRLVKSRGV